MAERLYRKKPNGTWYGWYYDQQGKQHCVCLRVTDKRAAQAVLRRLERQVQGTPRTAADEPTSPLGEVLQTFLEDRKLLAPPATVHMHEVKAGHLARILGNECDVNGLTYDQVQRYVSTRLREHAERETVRKELCTLRGALKLAAKRGTFASDPRSLIPELKVRYVPRDRYLTEDEFEKLCAQLSGERRFWLQFYCWTGARFSEGEAVTWENHVNLGEGWIMLPGTKTGKARRRIPIAPDLLPLMKARQKRTGPVLEPWPNVRRDIVVACKHAGIQPTEIVKKNADGTERKVQRWISPNDLRRSFASWLKQRHVDSLVVAHLLGHSSTRMVEMVYGRLNEKTYADAVALLAKPGTMGTSRKKAPATSTPAP